MDFNNQQSSSTHSSIPMGLGNATPLLTSEEGSSALHQFYISSPTMHSASSTTNLDGTITSMQNTNNHHSNVNFDNLHYYSPAHVAKLLDFQHKTSDQASFEESGYHMGYPRVVNDRIDSWNLQHDDVLNYSVSSGSNAKKSKVSKVVSQHTNLNGLSNFGMQSHFTNTNPSALPSFTTSENMDSLDAIANSVSSTTNPVPTPLVSTHAVGSRSSSFPMPLATSFSAHHMNDNGNEQQTKQGKRSHFTANNVPIESKVEMMKAKVLAMTLQSFDALQCRYTVKNFKKSKEKGLTHVQKKGYVEYKARYGTKRGKSNGFGTFNLQYLPLSNTIFPFQRTGKSNLGTNSYSQAEKSALIYASQVHLENVERVIVTIRLYKSYRGAFPTTVFHFSEDEEYESMYVKEWQDSCLYLSESLPEGVMVDVNKDGEFLRYIFSNREMIRNWHEIPIQFPCPLPQHPERFNNIGMMRMQVNVKFMLLDSMANTTDALTLKQGEEITAWVCFKAVQQIAKDVCEFSDMTRPNDIEWCLPQIPSAIPVKLDGGEIIRHVVGRESLQGKNACQLLEEIGNAIAHINDDDDTCDPYRTCLHDAAERGIMGVAVLLVHSKSTLVHMVDEKGNTPLHSAAEGNQASMLKLLYQAGAQLSIRNKDNETALDIANRKAYHSVAAGLKQLLEEDRSNPQIFRAASTGRCEHLLRLLRQRTDVDIVNGNGQSPLHLAIEHNQPWTVYLLVHHGASTRLTSHSGRMGIHQAAWKGNPETLIILLHGDPESVNLAMTNGDTPLHITASRGHVLCAQILLSCGADVSILNKEGQRAEDVAHEMKNADVWLILNDKSTMHPSAPSEVLSRCREGGSLHIAAKKGDLALALKLLAEGAKVSDLDADGHTAMHVAARNGRFLIVDAMLEHVSTSNDSREAKVAQVCNRDGMDALHLAATKDSISSAIVLLSRRACVPNSTITKLGTVLHRAAEHGQLFVAAYVRMFKYCRVDTPNSNGEKALAIAQQFHQSATAHVLRMSDSELERLREYLEKPPVMPQITNRQSRSTLVHLIQSDDFGKCLSRLWHCTLNACEQLRKLRQVES
eukprot:m.49104 g.49104  ORF g.49104 m.49104 type:complete len:1080 (-) comp7436_c1_seq1:2140-5379(-)